ncbi:MAG: VWA domain-containing protein [Desulfomonile tiedjei]|nr:VWA domain-containing protein [Desulfomonile tiedjei]
MNSNAGPARILYILTGVLIVLVSTSLCLAAPPGQGQLTIIEPDGKPGSGCPLEHTSVQSEISGFVARVEVKQIFHNPRQEKIEAVYTFPLSAAAAVDEMLMKVGERTVRGEIKRREEARRIYEAARDKGHVASLLDQERPNIFTQSVANIMPGERVEITIKYVEVLNYEDGAFRFVFPMVVGPRFIPGKPEGKQGTGWAKDTASVPDASRITPPVAEEGQRAGHDIDITVSIDAGVPVDKVDSLLHEVDTTKRDKNKVTVTLKNKKEIPNKDFVLKYLVAADRIRSGVLAHKAGEDGYVTVIMIPPKRVTPEQVAPRELIFIIDTSGSQRGFPLEKAKETTKYAIDRMNPNDTFNVIDFNDTSRVLFSSPKKNTPENREKALKYIASLEGNGGTRMIPAIWEALSTSPADNRLRVVTFMTDGLVGNDFEVISMIKKLRDQSRWFSFGTGNSVNRFLLDNVARVGGGEVDYILLNTSGDAVAKKFYERIAAPVLTDLSLTFSGVALEEVYPKVVSDLWSHKPLIFKARYSKPGEGTVTIKGFKGGKPYEETLRVKLPEKEPANSSVKSLWARAKVDDLTDRDLMGIQRGNPKQEVKEEIVKVALSHKIMTQFTSFVAVEEAMVTVDGKPTKVTVPVEMPEGVSREGVFGERRPATVAAPSSPPGAWNLPLAKGRVLQGSLQTQKLEGFAMAKGLSKPAGSFAPSAVEEKKGLLSDKEARADLAASKLSPELAELLAMKEKPRTFAKGKVSVKDGKIAVQVWLNRSGEDVIKLLKEKGLKITFTASTGKTVIGEISIELLEELAKVPEVRLIEPFTVAG